MLRDYKIWLELEDRFDVDAFNLACVRNGKAPMDDLEFATHAGLLACAMNRFKGVEPQDAMKQFMDDYREKNKPVEKSPIIQPRGLGDTIANITHATGLDKLATLYTNITGKECGCKSRQEALNKLLPYGFKEN